MYAYVYDENRRKFCYLMRCFANSISRNHFVFLCDEIHRYPEGSFTYKSFDSLKIGYAIIN